jgi:hypothetical protein
VHAEEDLKALNTRFRALEKESKNSRTKWESERTQLMGGKTDAEADADRHRTATEAADEECVRAYQAKEEAEARLAELTELHSALEARVEPLTEAAEQNEKIIASLAEEVQTLRRDVNYVLPAGVLKLVHVPSYTEVLWASPGVLEPKQPVSGDEQETAWRAVVEFLRLQHRDVAAVWQFIEDQHVVNPDTDVYGDLYRATKMAIETISGVLVEQMGRQLAGACAGNSLATDLVGLQARSQARIEVQEMTTAQDPEAAEL